MVKLFELFLLRTSAIEASFIALGLASVRRRFGDARENVKRLFCNFIGLKDLLYEN